MAVSITERNTAKRYAPANDRNLDDTELIFKAKENKRDGKYEFSNEKLRKG